MKHYGKKDTSSIIAYPFNLSGSSKWESDKAIPTARRNFGYCFDWKNGRVLISGGTNGAVVTNTKYTYDGVTWYDGPTMATSVYAHAQVHYGNDVWITGGIDGSGIRSSTAQRSLSGTDSFVSNPGGVGLPSEHSNHCAVVYNDRIYILGGADNLSQYSSNKISYFNGTSWSAWVNPTASWSARKDFASVVWKGKVWVLGGETSAGVYSAEVWNTTSPETNSAWTQISPVGTSFTARAGLMAFVYNDVLYVYGGFNGATFTDLYSTVDGTTWVKEVDLSGLLVYSYGMALTCFGNQVLLGGGTAAAVSGYTALLVSFPNDLETIYGNVNVIGTLHAKKLNSIALGAYYADLGEYFHCSEELPVGSKVSITGIRTVGKYNGKNFAGVITVNSGLQLGVDLVNEPDAKLIALVGTVLMEVEDENLVTGDKVYVGDEYVAIAQSDYSNGTCMVLLK